MNTYKPLYIYIYKDAMVEVCWVRSNIEWPEKLFYGESEIYKPACSGFCVWFLPKIVKRNYPSLYLFAAAPCLSLMDNRTKAFYFYV